MTTLTVFPVDADHEERHPRRRSNVWHIDGDGVGRSACGEHRGMTRPARDFLRPGKLFRGCFRCVTCFYMVHCGVRAVTRR